MAIDTEVYLLKNTKLYPGSEDTYYFASEAARQSFFIGKAITGGHLTALSFQREQKNMRLNVGISTAEQCDYLMFKNASYYNKWFYCFITAVKYINDEVTEISFEVDPVQTWLSSCTIGTSFIERETTNSDTYGEHLLDEGLGPGELYPYDKVDLQGGVAYLVFAVTRFVYPGNSPSDPDIVGANIQVANLADRLSTANFFDNEPNPYYTVEPSFDWQQYGYGCAPYIYIGFPTTAPISRINAFIDLYTSGLVQDNDGVPLLTPDHIVGAFIALRPAFMWENNVANQPHLSDSWPFIALGKNGWAGTFNTSPSTLKLDIATINPGTSGFIPAGTMVAPTVADGNKMFNGYQPRNKKCLQYPFVQMAVDDRNGGNSGMLRPEFFGNKAEYPSTDDNTIYLSQYAFINGCRCERGYTITHYNKGPLYSQIFDLPPLPTFSFNASLFATWQQTQGQFMAEQQRVNMERAGLNMSLSMLSAGLTGNALGAGAALVSGVADMAMQGITNEMTLRQATATAGQQPPLSRGAMSGSGIMALQAANNSLWPCAIKYCSRIEAVRAADIYFEQYGYKVIRRGTPTFTGRTRFYYIRGNLSFSSVTGVPAMAQKDILALFSRGLRFWRGDYLGDYSVANAVSS